MLSAPLSRILGLQNFDHEISTAYKNFPVFCYWHLRHSASTIYKEMGHQCLSCLGNLIYRWKPRGTYTGIPIV